MNSRKVVFIGIDALDKTLLLKWSDEGYLPNFKQLLSSSYVALTTPPKGLYVGGIWPSFATSCSPARHLSYCFRQLRFGSYDDLTCAPEDLKVEPFWNSLSKAGKRVAVIDVPRVPLSKDINGLHLADWCGHDAIYPEAMSWPPELAAQIQAEYGSCEPRDCDSAHRTAGDYAELREQLIDRAARKAQASINIMKREDWDLFMTVFSESHCAGHQCWHLHDEHHDRHSAAVGDVMRDVYIAIDQQIGGILAQIPEHKTVFVLASHGMGPHYDGTYILDDILRRIEGMEPTTGARGFATIHRLWQKLPQWLRGSLRFLDGARKHRIRSRLLAADRANRKYFSVSNNDANGGIRINLIGREPQGKVQPGAEFERVCAELIHELKQLTNSETGMPLIKEVFFTRDHHAGGFLDHLPDLLIEWHRSEPIRVVESPLIGRITGQWSGGRSGDHTAAGMLFVKGPGIAPVRSSQVVPIVDIGATIVDFMGKDLAGIDGRTIKILSGNA